METAFGAGWNNSEDWGCWTGERFSWLYFILDDPTTLPVFIDLHLQTFFPNGGRRRLVIGTRTRVIADVVFNPENAERLIRVSVGTDDVDQSGRVEIVLESSSVVSPSEAGGSDFRMIAFALTAVGLTPFH